MQVDSPATDLAAILSPREREVAEHIMRGATNRQIAASLGMAEGTAAIHVGTILRKLGLRSRAHIVRWAAGLEPETETTAPD